MSESVAQRRSDGDCDRRQQMLEAAERCFVRSGFHGARMAEIAKEAGTSPGLIYHYFASKESIIAELIAQHVIEKRADLLEIERSERPALEVFLDGLEEKLASSLDPCKVILTLDVTAEATRNEEVARILQSADEELRTALTRIVAPGLSEEEASSRVEVFLALVQGLGMRQIRNPNLPMAEVTRLIRMSAETLFAAPAGGGEA